MFTQLYDHFPQNKGATERVKNFPRLYFSVNNVMVSSKLIVFHMKTSLNQQRINQQVHNTIH